MPATRKVVRVDSSVPRPDWVKAELPWDAACKLKVVRSDYRPNEVIDPGVNFFVLTLEALGARTKYSCEGHPGGFYVYFKAPYAVAQAIQRCGNMRVEVGRDVGWWRLSIGIEGEEMTDSRRKRVLRWAAMAWRG